MVAGLDELRAQLSPRYEPGRHAVKGVPAPRIPTVRASARTASRTGPDATMTTPTRYRLLPIVVLLLAAAGGCEPAARAEAAAEPQPVHVDSIFPIEEEIRRFRAAIGPEPAALAGGAESREALVEAFVRALEADDLAALEALKLTVEEFAYLYYPHTRFTARPYELAPGLVWMQLENYGSKGLSRARARFAGRPLGYRGHACPDEPETEGPNRLWSGCVVRGADAAGEPVDLSLFGAILERDGRFKFVGYGNRL